MVGLNTAIVIHPIPEVISIYNLYGYKIKMIQPFLQVCDSPEWKNMVRLTLKGCCSTYVM